MYAQASQRTHEKQGWLRQLFNYLAPKLLSGHGKRVMLLSSLYFELTPSKQSVTMKGEDAKLHDDAIQRLNEIMDVAKSTSAMRFPAIFKSLIWRDCNIREIISEEDFLNGVVSENVVTISERLVDRIPAGFQYETRPKMIKEFSKLLLSGPQLAHAA